MIDGKLFRLGVLASIAVSALAALPAAGQVVTEVDPNDTFAQADASPVQISATTAIIGSIGTVGDVDAFRLAVGVPSVIRFETFDATGQDCATPLQTTTLRVYDSGGAQIWVDNTTGIQNCSALVVPVAVGTYYVRVEEFGNNATLAAYRLHVVFQADAGSEVEPNETSATSSPNLAGGTDRFVLGGHQVNTDSDFFSVTVAAGQSIRAEIIEANRMAETCESLGIDSRLTLFGPDGTTQLVDDDDAGRGFCSLVDGTGGTPLHAAAHNLAAGTYFLQVRASTIAQSGAGGQFDYRLVVKVGGETVPVQLMRLTAE